MRALSCVGLLRRAGVQIVRSYSSHTANAPDTFGLEAMEVNSYVQGLKIGIAKVSELPADTTSLPPPPNEKFEVYNKWIKINEERAKSQKNVESLADSEVVHRVEFGTLRFDNDNLPSEDEFDYSPDTRYPVMQRRHAEDEFEPTNPEQNDSKAKGVKESAQHKAGKAVEREGGQATNVGQALKSESETHGEPTLKTPLIYKIEPLNHLTHADVWCILKKQIVFENEFLLAINKPFGLPMHNPSTDSRHTLNDFLVDFSGLCRTDSVYPLHRIDKDTTGILLLAKTQEAATLIKERFSTRKVKKTYLAITKNCPEVKEGTVRIPIAEGKIGSSYRSVLKPDLRKYNISSSQSNSKEAITHFKVLNSRPDASFLEVTPETGLKHQIRIHLATALGSPILGDHKYSHVDRLAPQRLSPSILKCLKVTQSRVRDLPIHLHCSSIKFSMPQGFSKGSEDIFVHSRPPKYFMHTLRALGLK